jgi:hypothetical protein
MKIPGFGAEWSLTSSDYRFQAGILHSSGNIEPALGSTVYPYPHGEVAHLDHPGVPNCLKHVCTLYKVYDPSTGTTFPWYGEPCWWQSAHCY